MEFTFRTLLEKYLSDSISDTEKETLFQMLRSSEYNEELEQIIDAGFLEGKISGLAEEDKANILFNRIAAAGKIHQKRFLSRRLRYTAVAAAIFLLLAGSVYTLRTNRETPASAVNNNELVPGTDKAMLTLADGSVIVLDSTGSYAMKQGNTAIRQVKGKLQYVQHAPDAGIRYNTLTTPRGGQFRLTLPDGSEIWLNAASSITYPTAFSGSRRKVSVSGEVYMEIAKNENMPFEVSVKDIEVTVLGTSFNINAYDDEPFISATLVEGAVKVSRNNNDQLLMPGQQEQLLPDGTFKITEDIDTAAVIAWKNGMFSFNDADIPAVMRQVNRWYDAEIIYKSEVSQHFMGNIPRTVPISKLLTMLELTGRLHFKVDGKKIIVTQ